MIHSGSRLGRIACLATFVACTASSQAAFDLLEDFEGYTPGAISPQSTNWTFNTADGTVGSASGNQYLIQGTNTNAHTVFNNGSTLLADNATGTYFFRALMPAGGSHNGTSPSAKEGYENGWSDGGAIIRLGGSNPGTTIFGYDEAILPNGNYRNLTTDATTNVWYNFWVVLNNAGAEGTRSYDLYIQRDGDATFNTQQQIGNDLLYRDDANTQIGSIESIWFRSANDGVAAHFDDLYFDPAGENLINPIGAGVDTDGDGMPDSFELAYTDPPSATALDKDDDLENGGAGDGLNNLAEFLNKTNPLDDDTDDDTLLDGAEVNGTSNLFDGAPTSPILDDTDGDKVSDADENGALNTAFANAPTNPNERDTDGDGMEDDYELANNNPGTALDPNSMAGDQAPSGDRDSDTLTNIAEYDPAQGPNPNSPRTRADLADTDQDGYDDRAEDNFIVVLPPDQAWAGPTQTGTDPTNPDTDGDGLLDGDENPDLSFPVASPPPYNSDPNLADTDGDEFDDLYETIVGTNPESAASVPVQSSGFTLVEDFEGAGMVVSQTFAGVNGWSSSDSNAVTVADEPIAGSDQVGCVVRVADPSVRFNLFKRLSDQGLQILDGNTGTLFLQMYVSGNNPNLAFGLSDVSSPVSWPDFETYSILFPGKRLQVRDGNATRDRGLFRIGEWMNVWIVPNNATGVVDTVKVYFEAPMGETGQFDVTADADADPYGFRNGTEDPLRTLHMVFQAVGGAGTEAGTTVYIDNIYVDPVTANLTTPAAAKPSTVWGPLSIDSYNLSTNGFSVTATGVNPNQTNDLVRGTDLLTTPQEVVDSVGMPTGSTVTFLDPTPTNAPVFYGVEGR